MTEAEPELAARIGPDELLAALANAGGALAADAASAGLSAPVPSCPGWEVRDLLRHTSGVHRWATRYVVEQLEVELPAEDLEAFVGGWPPDGALVEWFAEGHRALVAALSSAPEDLSCWTFLPAPTPRWFWIRRQAHETAMHGVDAALAAGRVGHLEVAFSADGLDEMLLGFVPRYRRRLRAEPPRELVLRSIDSGDAWTIRLDENGSSVQRGSGGDAGRARTEVRGPASALYRWVWGRAGSAELEVAGDPAPLRSFEETVHVSWS